MMRHLPCFLAVLGLTTIACGSSRGRSGYEDPAEDTRPDTGEDDDTTTAGSLGSSSGEPSTPATCAATVSKANRAEVDVIVVIDTSGSMSEETNQVKQNLNSFAQSIGNSGLDYNVIMIASKPKQLPFPLGTTLGICVPPPLAGADCSDGPKFHHLDTSVQSTDSLSILLSKYPQYSAWLRPTAYKVFIEVTDDNASLKWDSFDTQLLAKSAQQFGDATNRRYIFNSICGYKRNTAPLSGDKCGSAENTGEQYQRLSQLTGGTIDSVCESSYASVFDNIAKGLVTKLGCEFAIPAASDGQQADTSTVVVTYTAGDSSVGKALTQVTDASKCGTIPDGWYYDDAVAPTKILFCPSTCSGPGADTAGKLEVAVGCKAPPPK